MSDKKQPETEQPRQQNKGWSWGKWIIMIVLGVFSLFICWLYLSPEFICWLRLFPKQWSTKKHIWLQLYLGALAVAGVVALCKPQIITSSSEKYFITRVLTTGITGGAFALLLPIAVKSTTTGVGGLRHSILLATGGLLAILTLGETRRKNDIDKHKNDQEKDKNDKDYRRQVRAERRERYTKAVEQLGDEKAPIRMGGVYTLVGLVDEWLEDESIKKYEDRLKEGQVIINNLCAYIRSPFTLASRYYELSQDTPTTEVIYKNDQQKSHKKWQIISSNLYACIRSRFTPDSRHDELSQDGYTAFYKDREQEFYADKATLDSEADVRLSIIKEIHDRLQGSDKNTPGAWSEFEYDFSGSAFFYPIDLTNSYYTKPINFSGSTYRKEANFCGSTYEGEADFSRSIYKNEVYFSSSKYGDNAYFNHSIYQGEAIFRRCEHKGSIIFKESIYGGNVDYENCIYGSRNINNIKVDFTNSIYISDVDFSATEYNCSADCSNSIYCGKINFSDSTYFQSANFKNSIYNQEVNIVATYEDSTYFNGSIFYNSVHFKNSEVIHSYGADKSYWIDKTAKFTKYPPHFSYTCDSSEIEYEELYEELYIKYGDPDVSLFYNFTIRTLFGEHNNSFDVSQNYEYTLERNSKNLPLHCDLLTSSQKEYLEDKFKIIKSVFNKFLNGTNPRENKFYLNNLKSITKELHKWREKATLKATPEIHKFYENNILENPED
ncbi:hypothetical protein HMPREF3016_05390 [Rothia sp. HMSC065D02]|uniref:pentapeptide repeat-containing protein n=1 Tax=Rothia sp. HMSC065D02 TaxID=1739518 RepID=UPI0008A13E51|nr:pentapeptide repeat-containing protein [Rothia sp. HMSC065D02]OFO77869.1 hypothetical protein HMPREF3016_05390 [Rothia sp. HMSC065D02]